MAQWVFALYVAVVMRSATQRRNTAARPSDGRPLGRAPHDARAPPLSASVTLWPCRHLRCLRCLCWSVLVSAAPVVWNSLRTFQSLPDTFNPGYFVVKCASSIHATVWQSSPDSQRMSSLGVWGLRRQ